MGAYVEEELAESVRKYYCAPYAEIAEYHCRMLGEVTGSAARSPIYAGRIGHVESLDGLGRLPMTGWDDIERTIDASGRPPLLARPAKYWQTSGYSGTPKRIYFGPRDLDAIYRSLMELLFIAGALEADLTLWSIGVGDPYLPGSIFDATYEKYKNRVGIRAEFVSEPATDEQGFIRTLRKASRARGVNAMAAYPIVYYLVAMAAKDPDWLGDKVTDAFRRLLVLPRPVLPWPLAKALAGFYLGGIDYAAIRETMRNVRTGFVFGESLEPYREYVHAQYPAIAFHNLLGSTELLAQALQIDPRVDGMSVLLRSFVPEIARMEDVAAARADPERQLTAIPWTAWTKGLRGELILTRPGECLPLVRYPTGDYVEVLDPAHATTITRRGAEYRITLPLIRALGRTMDTVDFEVPDASGSFFGYKFYAAGLERSLRRLGDVRWWELYKLHGSPGRYLFWVVPGHAVADPAAYKRDLARCLLDPAEDHAVSFSLAMELNRLEIIVAEPAAFGAIEAIIGERLREGRPIGQAKPRHVFILKSEAEYEAVRKKKRAA